jgi:hypothetical protein
MHCLLTQNIYVSQNSHNHAISRHFKVDKPVDEVDGSAGRRCATSVHQILDELEAFFSAADFKVFVVLELVQVGGGELPFPELPFAAARVKRSAGRRLALESISYISSGRSLRTKL